MQIPTRMKTIKLILVNSCLFAILTSCSMKKNIPNVVSSVDLNRYAGKWYEIASYPVSFQKNCYFSSDQIIEKLKREKFDIKKLKKGVQGCM